MRHRAKICAETRPAIEIIVKRLVAADSGPSIACGITLAERSVAKARKLAMYQGTILCNGYLPDTGLSPAMTCALASRGSSRHCRSSEIINRLLGNWRDAGWLRLSDRSIALTDVQALRTLLRDDALE